MSMKESNRFDIMWHCNTFVTPNVVQFIGLSNDVQRHGREHLLGFFQNSHWHGMRICRNVIEYKLQLLSENVTFQTKVKKA
jgi:hypothetical protein